MVGITYTAVEAQYTTCPENVHECAQHALWAIWGASLKADLLGVSSSFNMSRVVRLPLLFTLLAMNHSIFSQHGLALVLRSKGCVTAAAKHDAEPPNQNG